MKFPKHECGIFYWIWMASKSQIPVQDVKCPCYNFRYRFKAKKQNSEKTLPHQIDVVCTLLATDNHQNARSVYFHSSWVMALYGVLIKITDMDLVSWISISELRGYREHHSTHFFYFTPIFLPIRNFQLLYYAHHWNCQFFKTLSTSSVNLGELRQVCALFWNMWVKPLLLFTPLSMN